VEEGSTKWTMEKYKNLRGKAEGASCCIFPSETLFAGEAERQLTTGKMQKQKQDLLSAMGFDTALGEAEDALNSGE
jgi:hypothetical protein